jgi:hypothetical protein
MLDNARDEAAADENAEDEAIEEAAEDDIAEDATLETGVGDCEDSELDAILEEAGTTALDELTTGKPQSRPAKKRPVFGARAMLPSMGATLEK